MRTQFPIQNCQIFPAAIVVAVTALTGCAVHPPPAPLPNPADADAPTGATAPHRPTLLTSSRTFLSPVATSEKALTSRSDPIEPSAAAAVFTCPMHPDVHETKPGTCPICRMTLVKITHAPEGAKP